MVNREWREVKVVSVSKVENRKGMEGGGVMVDMSKGMLGMEWVEIGWIEGLYVVLGVDK